MSDDLDHELERLAKRLPVWAARTLLWLRKSSSAWARWPIALLLIVGGFLSFLPILGFWMLPLGLVLIAEDVPFLRRPLARLVAWINDRWGDPKPARAGVLPPRPEP